jgi:N-acetylated-alpha-linked acidic dipeptidase
VGIWRFTPAVGYSPLSWVDRVENLASISSINPNFSDLREAINDLQSASAKLDEEKEEAEFFFKDMLHKLLKRHGSCRRRKFRQIADWIKKLFGVHPHHGHHHSKHGYWMDVAFGTAGIRDAHRHEHHVQGDDQSRTPPLHHWPPRFPIHKFIKAAKRVRKANQKLVAFERGFISVGGIRNRGWYKHLGVAPGLWLGNYSIVI